MVKKDFLRNVAAFAATAILAVYVGGKLPAMYKHWQGPFNRGDYSAHVSQQPYKITLYGTTTCEYCIAARTYLKNANIRFNDQLIDKSLAAKEKFEELNENAVPILVSSDQMTVGFNERIYAEFLKSTSN